MTSNAELSNVDLAAGEPDDDGLMTVRVLNSGLGLRYSPGELAVVETGTPPSPGEDAFIETVDGGLAIVRFLYTEGDRLVLQNITTGAIGTVPMDFISRMARIAGRISPPPMPEAEPLESPTIH